jgi:hypothetical protein
LIKMVIIIIIRRRRRRTVRFMHISMFSFELWDSCYAVGKPIIRVEYLIIACLKHSTLRMDAIFYSETLGTFATTRHQIPEDSTVLLCWLLWMIDRWNDLKGRACVIRRTLIPAFASRAQREARSTSYLSRPGFEPSGYSSVALPLYAKLLANTFHGFH